MNKRPTFDANGYPSEETILAIKEWEFQDHSGWLQYVREAWNHTYGKIWEENGLLKMATGGWSGNEEIISAMSENLVHWGMFWESSHRGGLEVFNVEFSGVPAGHSSNHPDSGHCVHDRMPGRECRSLYQNLRCEIPFFLE